MLPNFVLRPEIACKIGPVGIALIAVLIHGRATPKKGPSIRYLARAVGTTPARVIRTLRLLATENIVKVVKHRDGQQNGYDLDRIDAALRGESVPTGGTLTVPTGETVSAQTVPTGDTNSKTVDSIPRELPDPSGESSTIQHNGDGACGILSTAPIGPTAPGEAPRPETRTEPFHQSEQFGPAPDRTTLGLMVQEMLWTAGAEQVWHETFDKLIHEYGISVVWRQFNFLPSRVMHATKCIENIPGFFIESIKGDWSPPREGTVDKATFEKWCAERDDESARNSSGEANVADDDAEMSF